MTTIENNKVTLSVFYLSALIDDLPISSRLDLPKKIVWRFTQTLQQTYSPLQEVQVAFKVLMTRW